MGDPKVTETELPPELNIPEMFPSCLEEPKTEACDWFPNPDNTACFFETAKEYSGETESVQQTQALWREIPQFLKTGVEGTPQKAVLITVGDGYYGMMESRFHFMFEEEPDHVIAWSIPHVHYVSIGRGRKNPEKVTVNGEMIEHDNSIELHRVTSHLAGLTPMVIGALGCCCAK